MSDINAVNHIHCGDIRDIAKTLPAQSVNCIVTSPPYFGLRDYQTAEWEGGRVKCDHIKRTAVSAKSTLKNDGRVNFGSNNYEENTTIPYRDTCSKCGAKRIDKQIGLEATPEAYVNTMVGIFRELKRVLRDDGTVWLNLGDSYAGNNSSNGEGETRNLKTEIFHGGSAHLEQRRITSNCNLKPKNLIGIPWRVAFALQADGWILRSDIIWHKKNPMPESVTDRPTKSHEYIFLLSKQAKYYYDNEAVREANSDSSGGWQSRAKNGLLTSHSQGFGGNGETSQFARITQEKGEGRGGVAIPNPSGRNRRTVWTVSTKPYKAAHFAVFPPDLIRPCILAGCPQQVCSECGEPWRRITEKGLTAHDGKTDSQYSNGTTANRLALLRQAAREQGGEYVNTAKTIGIEPVCQCNASSRPGVVLDPFMGSGTVAQVAIETGRNWLGVELNPEYIELTKERIYQTQPPLPIGVY